MIRVYLVDDHEVVRRGLRDLLVVEGDIRIVGGVGTAADAKQHIPTVQPDVMVLAVPARPRSHGPDPPAPQPGRYGRLERRQPE